ncbi:hypothetical protein [Plantactinospora sonchi]|uniref:ESX secretion-associated protein EspG n=1 Tax=Plantactinospora sonchi TaxID=1544735 RepID=A0ABU7RNQ7_9ACTN
MAADDDADRVGPAADDDTGAGDAGTGTGSGARAGAGAASRRLVLSAAEWAVLVDRTGLRPPPGFGTGDPPPVRLRAAAYALAGCGVVTVAGDDPLTCEPVDPVAVNLATFAGARALVRVEVSVDGRSSRAVYAVAGPVGASLFALADGGVELSMFGAVALGAELVRAVPTVGDLLPQASALLGPALGGTRQPLTGRLPLAALAEYAPAAELAGTIGQQEVMVALRLSPAQAWLAEQVNARTSGVLRALVTGPVATVPANGEPNAGPGGGRPHVGREGAGPDTRPGNGQPNIGPGGGRPDAGSGNGPAGAGGLGVGQVVWLATDDGWLGIRPAPDGSGRRLVELGPVHRAEIGAWLAPYLAAILESGDGGS